MRYAHTAIRTLNREIRVGATYLYLEENLRVEARLIADESDDKSLVFIFRPLRSNRPSLTDDFTVAISREVPHYGGLWQIHDVTADDI